MSRLKIYALVQMFCDKITDICDDMRIVKDDEPYLLTNMVCENDVICNPQAERNWKSWYKVELRNVDIKHSNTLNTSSHGVKLESIISV